MFWLKKKMKRQVLKSGERSKSLELKMTKRIYSKIGNLCKIKFKTWTYLFDNLRCTNWQQPWKGQSCFGIGLPEKEEREVIRPWKLDDVQEKNGCSLGNGIALTKEERIAV